MTEFSETHIKALEALKDVVKALDGKRMTRQLDKAMDKEIEKRGIPCVSFFSMDPLSTQFTFYCKGDDAYGKNPDDKGTTAYVYGDSAIWIDAEYTNMKIDRTIEAEKASTKQVPYACIGIY